MTLNKFSLEGIKSISPFESCDSVNKFNTTKLPLKELFDSKKQSGITDEEYNQALNCWNETGCETKKDLLNYPKTDVLLLI